MNSVYSRGDGSSSDVALDVLPAAASRWWPRPRRPPEARPIPPSCRPPSVFDLAGILFFS